MKYEEIKKLETVTILKDWMDENVRVIIVRGPVSVVVYLGIPIDHTFVRKDYNNIELDCHGGLTFSNEGDGINRPEGLWWYGWDYAHAGDKAFYEESFRISNRIEWNDEMVAEDIVPAIQEFKKLMKLAEENKKATHTQK
mgnify:CR=1 FL=1